MATLYKRGKVWWISWKEDGKRQAISTGETNKREADKHRKQYQQKEEQAKRDAARWAGAPTLGEWKVRYLEIRSVTVAAGTLAKDVTALDSLQIPDRPLPAITTADIQDWYLQRLQTVSTASANSNLRHITTFFSTAVKQGKLKQSPCQHVSKARENHPHHDTLTKEQIKQLLLYLEENAPPEWSTIVRVAVSIGARAGELCRLKVKDISQNRVIIRSEDAARTKSSNSRTVPIPKHTQAFFQALVSDRQPDELLMRTPSGHAWRVRWLSRGFARLAKKAGLSCGIHDLRRAYGAWLIMSGSDVVTVQRNLGHSDVSVTVNSYAYLLDTHRQTATDRLPDFWEGL